jgi:aryl sulfotransferase
MTRTIWLASYPKSGNTWLRLLLANVSAGDEQPVDINNVILGGIASSRNSFDSIVLIDSGLLTHDEVDDLRPRAHAIIWREKFEDGLMRSDAPPVRFVKVHDAYTINFAGEALLGGSAAAHGAIMIVRDPRDVVSSLAHHLALSVDDAITFMANDDAALAKGTNHQAFQLRQKLRGWSDHVSSLLDQTDIPVHFLRYEDLHHDTVGTLSRALAFARIAAPVEKINRAVASCNFALLREREQREGFAEAPPRGVKFFRRGKAGAWRDELSREQINRIESRHWQIMQHLGYGLSGLWDLARVG